MPISLIFWVLMLFWVLFAGWNGFRPGGDRTGLPGSLLLFLLFLLLGMRAFGGPVTGG